MVRIPKQAHGPQKPGTVALLTNWYQPSQSDQKSHPFLTRSRPDPRNRTPKTSSSATAIQSHAVTRPRNPLHSDSQPTTLPVLTTPIYKDEWIFSLMSFGAGMRRLQRVLPIPEAESNRVSRVRLPPKALNPSYTEGSLMEGSQAHTKPVTDVEASRAVPTKTRITRPLYIGMQPESRN